MKHKVFRSRVSVLLIGLIVVVFIPIILRNFFLGMSILGGGLICIFFIYFGIRYVISGNTLYLKMWFFPPIKSARIDDIVSVERMYSMLSAPAASLKRLCIRFEQRKNCRQRQEFWLISPVREQEFIEELKSIDPDIYINVPLVEKEIWRFWDWDI